MRIGLISLCLALLATAEFAAAEQAPPPGEAEPPQRLVATVDGQRVEVVAGEPTRVQVNGVWVDLLIEPTGERTFDNGTVSFAYLDEMAFAFDDSEPALKQWFLDGQDCIIILQQPDAEIPFAEFTRDLVDIMQQGYGSMFEKREPVTMTLGGEVLSGVRLTASLRDLGVVITQDILFREHDGSGSVLILQDALTDEGEQSAEFNDMVDRLKRTLRWADAGAAAE